MKVKNIAFSGFAAAILATGAASAAPQIASKQYVDDKVKTDVQTLQTTIENNYTKTEQLPGVIAEKIATELQSDSSALKTAIDDKADKDTVNQINTTVENLSTTVAGKADKDTVNQISQTVESLGTTVAGKADTTTVNQISTKVAGLESDISGKADKLTGEAIKAGNVAVIDESGNYVAGTVASSELVTNTTVTEKITEALESNDSVKEIITDIVGDGTVVKDAIDNSVASGTLKTELDKKANAADVYTKTETDAQIIKLAIPQPTGACASESGRCVLSVDAADKSLTWLDVTAPLEAAGTVE